MVPVPSAKIALRRTLNARLAALAPAEAQAETDRLAALLGPWVEGRGFEVVLATLPLPGEPELTPLLTRWVAAGIRVALARTGPHRSLDFGYVDRFDGPWEPRPFGLREPSRDAPTWTPGPRTLVLVPGLGFAPAPEGGALRLGRGAGYYDRWLASWGSQTTTLGFGYTLQTLETLPVEDHDWVLDGWADPWAIHGLRPSGTER